MSQVTLDALLEAGTHFGHQKKRWNPKMKRYILCARNGVYVIDLNKTISGLQRFCNRVKSEVERGGNVLFVGTKKQIKDCIREQAERCNMPYVSERWLGGMLTNWQTLRQSIARLNKIETMEKDGTFEALTKKERLSLLKKKEKLLNVLSGIRHLQKPPSVVFLVDLQKEHIAVAETRRLRIPLGAIVDTNCDPEQVDYPIPGNDDAIKSVQLITKTVADAVLEASGGAKSQNKAEQKAASSKDEAEVIVEQAPEVEGESVEPVAAENEGGEEGASRKPRVVRRKFSKDEGNDE